MFRLDNRVSEVLIRLLTVLEFSSASLGRLARAASPEVTALGSPAVWASKQDPEYGQIYSRDLLTESLMALCIIFSWWTCFSTVPPARRRCLTMPSKF